MARIFEPFDRLGAESSEVEGTGLGLPLSKGLVEAMQGTIRVESEVGSGSVFTVELKLAEPPLQRYERELDEVDADLSRSNGSRMVLCIEDNPSNLALIERVVSRRPDLKLVSAMQGRLGLDLAREHHPDVILLDLHLPDMSGEEVLSRLREAPSTREIPVLMITADATQGRIKQLLNAGADGYLTKPLDLKRFLKVLDEALGLASPGQS